MSSLLRAKIWKIAARNLLTCTAPPTILEKYDNLEDYPDARIVMVSSLAYDDTIHEAKEIGAKNFVYKPLDRKQLLDAFEKALA